MLLEISSQQQAFDDIEIRIFKDYENGYTAKLSLQDYGRVSVKLPALPTQDLALITDSSLYGSRLFSWLFQGDLLDTFHDIQLTAAQPTRSLKPQSSSGLRLRLWIDPKASELHCLRWESLCELGDMEPLSLRTAFSRFIRSPEPRGWGISDRPLRMLLVASNPSGLDRFDLSRIEVDLEDRIVKEATSPLGSLIELNKLTGSITIDMIKSEERRGYHIIHLLAYTVADEDKSFLLLADQNNQVKKVPFEEIVDALSSDPDKAPYLVFLATPFAREEVDGTLLSTKLAPMLIESGIQAVVAIQSLMDAPQIHIFTQRFYEVLINTGMIDVAMATARTEIYKYGSWDWTYPVLYMRIPDAQIFQKISPSVEGNINAINFNSFF
jgi:hypothetical protein